MRKPNDHETELGLRRALRNTSVSVFYQTPDMRVAWAENLPPAWARNGSIIGLADGEFMPGEAASEVIAAKLAVLEGGTPNRLEIRLRPPPGEHDEQWFDMWIDADRDGDGASRGIITTIVETTEQKRREQTLRVLLREVSHRSRNLLAIIQSIATQTGRYSASVDTFLTRFRGRLQSLASSQDLVTSSNWRGANLEELVLGQSSRYSARPETIRLEGEKPWLNPNAALHVGLALHELIANSMSYGSLSRSDGHVDLFAELLPGDGEEGKPQLCFKWREVVDASGKPVAADAREKRFGSVALERIVPVALNGSAKFTIEDGVLEYTLVIPPGNFETDRS